MNNILYFRPQPPKEDEILLDITVHPKETDADNYFCILYRNHPEILCYIGIVASSFDNALMLKTIALQKLKDEFETVLQERKLTYYL